jgi:hypothetical protein
LFCFVLTSGGFAHADDAATEACLTAHTDGQKSRSAGKLLEAKQAFLECAANRCPDLVKEKCTEWLADAEQRIPTVVLDVRDDDDRDLSNVKVFVDGRLLSESLDGRSIPFDPGSHQFRFESPGHRTLERTYLLREGERSRRIDVKLQSSREKPRAAKPAVASDGLPWTFWALGGVGVLGIGAGSYFFFDGRSDVSQMRDSCAPSCSEAEVDDARAKIRAADVFLGVGVVALGTAAVIALTHGSSKERTPRARLQHPASAAWPAF